jgi:hypothetical protein
MWLHAADQQLVQPILRLFPDRTRTPIAVRGTPPSTIDQLHLRPVLNSAARHLARAHEFHYMPLDVLLEDRTIWSSDGTHYVGSEIVEYSNLVFNFVANHRSDPTQTLECAVQ